MLFWINNHSEWAQLLNHQLLLWIMSESKLHLAKYERSAACITHPHWSIVPELIILILHEMLRIIGSVIMLVMLMRKKNLLETLNFGLWSGLSFTDSTSYAYECLTIAPVPTCTIPCFVVLVLYIFELIMILTVLATTGMIDDLNMARFDALDSSWDVYFQKSTSFGLLLTSWVADGRGNHDYWMYDFNAVMSSNNYLPFAIFCAFSCNAKNSWLVKSLKQASSVRHLISEGKRMASLCSSLLMTLPSTGKFSNYLENMQKPQAHK